MKKILASILVIMLLLGCVLFTASCDKKKDEDKDSNDSSADTGKEENKDPNTLSGTYYDETGVFVITFEGNTITQNAFGMVITGTYTLGEGKITIYEEGEEPVEAPFEKGDGYIVIDDMRFTTTKPEPEPGLTGGDTILSGTYYDVTGSFSVTFDGNNISRTGYGMTVAGTYKIENGMITTIFAGETDVCTFEKGEGYIIIDGERMTSTKPEPEPGLTGGDTILSGTYYDDTGSISISFDGNNVTQTAYGQTLSGTYKIEGGTITMSILNNTQSSTFEKGDGYIVVDGTTFTDEPPQQLTGGDTILSGTYYDESGFMTLVFDGNNVTVGVSGMSLNGTYKIENGIFVAQGGASNLFSGECSFEKGEGYIVIDGDTYTTEKPAPLE